MQRVSSARAQANWHWSLILQSSPLFRFPSCTVKCTSANRFVLIINDEFWLISHSLMHPTFHLWDNANANERRLSTLSTQANVARSPLPTKMIVCGRTYRHTQSTRAGVRFGSKSKMREPVKYANYILFFSHSTLLCVFLLLSLFLLFLLCSTKKLFWILYMHTIMIFSFDLGFVIANRPATEVNILRLVRLFSCDGCNIIFFFFCFLSCFVAFNSGWVGWVCRRVVIGCGLLVALGAREWSIELV